MITSMGTICGEILTIAAATYPETFPVDLLLLGFALDGLTGSFIVAMAIANSYAADCTPPARRNVAFGYFHGCLFTGIALGPILAGYMVKVTGKIVIVFYVLTAVHLFFVAFVGLAVPESLSKRRQFAAREIHKKTVEEFGVASDWLPSQLRSLNLLEPLKVLWPTGPGSSPALRRNLFFLAAVDTIVLRRRHGELDPRRHLHELPVWVEKLRVRALHDDRQQQSGLLLARHPADSNETCARQAGCGGQAEEYWLRYV